MFNPSPMGIPGPMMQKALRPKKEVQLSQEQSDLYYRSSDQAMRNYNPKGYKANVSSIDYTKPVGSPGGPPSARDERHLANAQIDKRRKAYMESRALGKMGLVEGDYLVDSKGRGIGTYAGKGSIRDTENPFRS